MKQTENMTDEEQRDDLLDRRFDWIDENMEKLSDEFLAGSDEFRDYCLDRAGEEVQ